MTFWRSRDLSLTGSHVNKDPWEPPNRAGTSQKNLGLDGRIWVACHQQVPDGESRQSQWGVVGRGVVVPALGDKTLHRGESPREVDEGSTTVTGAHLELPRSSGHSHLAVMAPISRLQTQPPQPQGRIPKRG